MDTYAIVTEKIVNLLEQGIVPWRQPWASTGLPCNLVSKKPYRGVNLFLLSSTKYVSPFWLSMKQANGLGGTVRKGEHSQIVVFWKVDAIAGAEPQTNADTDEADEKSVRRFVLRYYRVFNLEQCDLPQAVLDKLPKIQMHHHDPIEACEKMLANMPNPPEIVHADDKAFYSPVGDRVTMPLRGLFESAEEYWSTLWHECGGHATGHPKRLTASRSAKPRHLVRPYTVLRSWWRNVQRLIYARKLVSHPRLSVIRLLTFRVGWRRCAAMSE